MPDYAALDTLVARLRSSNWVDLNDLANCMANVVSGVVKQPTFNRGLHDNVIADTNGGTTLAVGDNSAAKDSVSLAVPQRMLLQKQGAVATRQQARAEMVTKTVPAVVLVSHSDGRIEVALTGTKPKTSIDPLTGNLTSGNPISDVRADPADLASGDVMTVTLAGGPFILTDVHGTELPTVGQTVMVSVSEQSEKRTFWVNRSRRNFPRVLPGTTTSTDATLVNGLCCHKEGDGNPPGGT